MFELIDAPNWRYRNVIPGRVRNPHALGNRRNGWNAIEPVETNNWRLRVDVRIRDDKHCADLGMIGRGSADNEPGSTDSVAAIRGGSVRFSRVKIDYTIPDVVMDAWHGRLQYLI